MQKRVFIYARVSTDEPIKLDYSIQQQIERLKKYCEANEWNLVNIYTDDGYSGKENSRPALDQMIEEIEKGHADIVLVDKLDRFSRYANYVSYLFQKVFKPNNITVVSLLEALDTSTALGKVMIELFIERNFRTIL